MGPEQKRFIDICEKLLDEFFHVGDEYMILMVLVLIDAARLNRKEDASKLLKLVKNYVLEQEAKTSSDSMNDILSSEFIFPEGDREV